MIPDMTDNDPDTTDTLASDLHLCEEPGCGQPHLKNSIWCNAHQPAYVSPFPDYEDAVETSECYREGCSAMAEEGHAFCSRHEAMFVSFEGDEVKLDAVAYPVNCTYNGCANLSLFGESRCIDHVFTGMLDHRLKVYAYCDESGCNANATTRADPQDPWRCEQHPYVRPVEVVDYNVCAYPDCRIPGTQVAHGVHWCASHLPEEGQFLAPDVKPAPSVYSANGVYIAWYTADVREVLSALNTQVRHLHDTSSETSRSELGKTLFILSEAASTLEAWSTSA